MMEAESAPKPPQGPELIRMGTEGGKIWSWMSGGRESRSLRRRRRRTNCRQEFVWRLHQQKNTKTKEAVSRDSV